MSCNLVPSSDILLRDPQHAARLFGVDNFRLAPKYKFLFHVSFGINPSAVKSAELLNAHKNEINMLVKSVTLPAIDAVTATVNQYNRKKVVQTSHKFSAVTIKFHDDNQGIINLLWQNYYSYYYADPISATVTGAYKRNAMQNANYITAPYGLDNGSIDNFFTYIKIYQMARHQYVSYTLHNPLISKWTHDNLDYKSTEFHDNTVTIDYEAVSYGSGIVTPGDPEGFGMDHYDQTPSPLTGTASPGPAPLTPVANLATAQNTSTALNQINSATNSLYGIGQAIGGISSALGGVGSAVGGISSALGGVGSAIGGVASAVNTVGKTVSSVSSVANAVGGLANTVFPAVVASQVINAIPVKLF